MRHTQTFLELQTLEPLVLPPRPKELKFGSRSEMACGLLAEKYIPGFELIQGKTFQIPIGKRQIDFRIRNSFIEYHPIVIEREFSSIDCARRLFEALGQIDDYHKKEIYSLIREELRSRYFRKRKEAVESLYPHGNLILCTSASEFYEFVLMRFGENVPGRERFMIEWDRVRATPR